MASRERQDEGLDHPAGATPAAVVAEPLALVAGVAEPPDVVDFLAATGEDTRVSTVTAMQRTTGNRAVSRMILARAPAVLDPPAPAPAEKEEAPAGGGAPGPPPPAAPPAA